MTVKEFIKRTHINNQGYKGMKEPLFRPVVFCKDGFNVSIQASEFHYCTPREFTDKYSRVEIGYPSLRVPEFSKYIDNHDNYLDNYDHTNAIFPFVPVSVVEKVVKQHGGIDFERTIKTKK